MKNSLIKKLLNDYLDLLRRNRSAYFSLLCRYKDGRAPKYTEEFLNRGKIYATNQILYTDIKIREMLEILEKEKMI